MSIDSALKRASAIHVSCPWRGILPFPDAAITQRDRQTVPFMYSGILAGGITPPTPGTIPPYKGFIVNVLRPMGGWSK